MSARPDDGWYQDEPPLRQAAIAELQRLKNRARARWPWVVVIALALTSVVVWRKYKKVKVQEASVVLAVSEGTLASGHQPIPLADLHDYIDQVLLSDKVLAQIIDEEHIPHRFGLPSAIADLREMYNIGVYRNYFLYEYEIDSPRSARIAIVVTDPNGSFAWHLAHVLADRIVDGEIARSREVAQSLAKQAAIGLDDARREADALVAQISAVDGEIARAEEDGDRGHAAVLRLTVAGLDADLKRKNDLISQLSAGASADAMSHAIDEAGLGLRFDVASEQKPDTEGPTPWTYKLMVGGVLFSMMLPVVALVVGAFDTRVHDASDIVRLGLPVFGQVPGFPGDGVGSLRARGMRRRRVPSS